MMEKITIFILLAIVFIQQLIIHRDNARIAKLEQEVRNWRIVS